MTLAAAERRQIAQLVGCNEQFLYQCLTGRNAMDVREAVRVERESEYRIRRWDLRTKDWWQCWPELIGTPGAPDPTPATQEARDAG